MALAQLEVLGEHAGAMKVGRWKNLVMVAWNGPATGPATATLARIMVLLHASTDEVRSYVHLIPNRVRLPDANARSNLTGIMCAYEPYIACVGVVIAGTGFWASAMRNVVIGLRLLVRTPFDYRIHTHADELLGWLPAAHQKRTGVLITAPELSAMLSEARRWQRVLTEQASLPRG